MSSAVTQGQSARDCAITGTIRDSASSAPIRAAVALYYAPDDNTSQYRSNSKGEFCIVGAPAGGPYKITISAAGYADAVRDGITVVTGQATRVEFSLVHEQPTQQQAITAPSLGTVDVSTAKRGSSLAVPFIDEAGIRAANAPNALAVIQRARPAMLAAHTDICTGRDSLTVYVDGRRWPFRNSMLQPGSSDPLAELRADSADVQGTAPNGDWSRSMQILTEKTSPDRAKRQNDAATLGKDTYVLPNQAIVESALKLIPSDAIQSISYVGCDATDPKTGLRNVILVTTKRHK